MNEISKPYSLFWDNPADKMPEKYRYFITSMQNVYRNITVQQSGLLVYSDAHKEPIDAEIP